MYDKINKVREELGKFTPDNLAEELPLLHELLQEHYHAKPAVDIERACLMTEYFKKVEAEEISMPVKRANAVSNYLSKRKVFFHDRNMLGGSTTGKVLGAPLYPEFFGLSIWPELLNISTRESNPQTLNKEDADILNFEIFPYWMDRSVAERARKIDPERQSIFEKLIIFSVSKAATISHTTPCYEKVLKLGINQILNKAEQKEKEHKYDPKKCDFYHSVKVAMQGILDYAQNIAQAAEMKAVMETEPRLKENYMKIARTCEKVPAEPASSFREAVNSLWISQVAIFAENSNMAINPGRLDQILYPYFIKEYEAGTLSIEEALNIAGCLWFKIADNVNLVPEASEKLFGGAGAVPAITLGGVDKNGEDAVNELTYVLLKVTELLPIRDPNVNARFHPDKNKEEYRNEVSKVILTTKAIPAFFNDRENIETLIAQGEKEEHARDYAVIGCVELGSAGRDYSASSSIFMMMYTVLYMVLHNGRTPATGDQALWKETGNPEDFRTFDDVWEAYKEQTRLMADSAISLNNTYGEIHQEFVATPVMSAMFEGPMEKGMDVIDGGAVYNSSGITHIGFADVCDSLCAIKELCFNDNNPHMKMTLPELVKAVDNNFKDYELLESYLRNKAPKYGTGHPAAVEMSQKLIDLGYEIFNNKKNYRGGNHRVAYWTMTNHAGYGAVTGAMPNGRKANVPFSSGITPASQIDTDLTTSLNSVACLNSSRIPGAYALNMKFSPVESSDENTKRFGSIVEGYMEKGGQQVQFNIHDYKTLKEAKEDPDSHPHLLVRVSGYSAYFNSLNEAMKEELIVRSQYNLLSGEFVPL